MLVTTDAADRALGEFLRSIRTAAVVGCSPRPDRPSHEVARYLQDHGIRMVPVNPGVTEVLGETAYPDIDTLPTPPDVVVVFRRAAEVPAVADAAVRRGARGLWLQLGIRHQQAEAVAARAGLVVIADRCIKIEHARLIGDSSAESSAEGVDAPWRQ